MKQRITHIIAGLNIGGANVMLLKLLKSANKLKLEHSVIAMMDKGVLGDQIEALGIPVHLLEMQRGKPTPSSLRCLSTLLKRIQPDLVQAWMYHGNFAASIGNLFLVDRLPILWNIRHTPYRLKDEKLLTHILIRLGAPLSRLPKKVIYNSYVSARRHEEIGYHSDRTKIIPNGFDTLQFTPNRAARFKLQEELAIPKDSYLIGMIARYHPMKDHINFIHAAAILKHQRLGVHFILVGRNINTRNHELVGLINALSLEGSVHLLGEREDIALIDSALDIATLTSAWGEGFPNVIGEAMACGIPCVVTDIGDSAQIVGDTGIVVKPGNPQALSSAWDQLLRLSVEERRNLGKAARERIIKHYRLTSIVAMYEELYGQVLSQ